MSPTASTVAISERFIRNNRGTALYTRQYFPNQPGEYAHVLLFVHGVHEHSGRYHDFFCAAARAGIAVHTLDLQGHGRSHGRRGDCLSFDDLVQDVVVVADAMMADYSAVESNRLKFVVGGLSLGGLLAAHVASSKLDNIVWHGLALLAPTIEVETNWVLTVQRRLANFLVRAVPTLQIVPALPPHEMSRDNALLDDYKRDPLNHPGQLRMRMGWAIVQGMNGLDAARRAAITMPLLVLHGTDDKVTSPRLSREFFDQVPTSAKVYHALRGQRHLLLHEPEKKANTALVLDWIKAL